MQTWQIALLVAVTLASEGPIVAAIVRMFSRRSSFGPAVERRATAFESALVGGAPDSAERGFDVFSYRVAARFAGKARIVVGSSTVVVAGPRVPVRLYQFWIWLQGLLLGLVPPLLAWALVALDWRGLAAAVAVLVLSFGISAGGAGLWPGLGEMEFVTQGAYRAIEVPLSAVSDIALGEGWSRGGMDVVLLPYKKGVDAMARNGAVSFDAPDERGHLVRYALHCPAEADARELAALLGAGGAG